ncbi:MAG: apolipoprotein N-acyltransferase [Myxococcota bacterium]
MLSRLTGSLHRLRYSYGLAAISGGLTFTGFCGFDQWYLAWICLVPVLWALDDESLSGWEALGIAWFFGAVTHVGGYTWLAGMLRDFGHLPWPLAILGMVLLSIGQSTLFAAWGWLTHRLVHRHNAPIIWVAPVALVLAEWLMPALFPTYQSNSQYRQIIFIQSLDIWGPLGLTFILTLFSSIVYETIAWKLRGGRKLPTVAWVVFTVLLIANLGYGYGAAANIDDTVAHADERIRVGLVQANMGIYEKDKKRSEGLRRHRQQSLELERQGAELIVWPESGYNYAIQAGTENLAARVLGPVTTPLIFGGMRWVRGTRRSEDREIYNSAYLLDGDGWVLGTYDKTYLLAFGEYLPFGETFPWLYDLSPHSGRFTRGERTEPLVHGNIKYGVMICYEDIVPSFVRGLMEHEPHVLVNITNDAWFGRSREPTIHLALATFRAVEHRRFLVRATNTGVSAFIDPAGRITQETPIFARANLIGDVTPLHGRTLYGRLGDWFSIPCVLVVLFWWRKPFKKLAARLRPRKA